MKKAKTVIKSPFALMVLFIISVFSIAVFYSTRFTWKVTDFGTGVGDICFIIFGLMGVSALFSASLLFLRAYKFKSICESKLYDVALISAMALTMFFLCVSVYSAHRMIAYESHFVMWMYFKEALPVVGFVLLLLTIVVLPAVSRKKQKGLISIILAVSIIAGVVGLIPNISYKIVADPMVIDNGNSYSVVFATNAVGTGYIEYTYNDKDYKVYDVSYGKLKCDSKIHSINIPYEHLQNNEYKVGSTNVIEEFSYGSIKGKTAVSQSYLFTYDDSSMKEFLLLSDWHTNTGKVYDAVEYAGDYDAIVLMGDSSPGVDFEEEVIKYTVEVAGRLSGGVKPVIYLRGNHETRGSYAHKLGEALGLNSFYYNTQMGGCTFIVLDSAEDKATFYAENGGLTEGVEYFNNMAAWLKNSDVSTEGVIALSHSWKVCDNDKALSHEFHKELKNKGVSLLLSGHTHESRLVGEGDDEERRFAEEYSEINAYMCGGIKDNAYVVSKLIISEGGFTLESYDNNGKTIFDESFKW